MTGVLIFMDKLFFVLVDGKKVTKAMPESEAKSEADQRKRSLQESLANGAKMPSVTLAEYITG